MFRRYLMAENSKNEGDDELTRLMYEKLPENKPQIYKDSKCVYEAIFVDRLTPILQDIKNESIKFKFEFAKQQTLPRTVSL